MGALVSVNVSVSGHVLRLWERMMYSTVFSVLTCGFCSGSLSSVNVSVRVSVLRFWVLIVWEKKFCTVFMMLICEGCFRSVNVSG